MLDDTEGEFSLTSAIETKSRTVCLLDDDPSVVKATSRLLSSAGWKVDSFTDPFEFLRHAESCQPRVVVLDILMPAMNGLEVQTRLRSVSPSTRVIVLTAKDDSWVFKRYTPETREAAGLTWSRRAWGAYPGLGESTALLVRFCLESGAVGMDTKLFLSFRPAEEAKRLARIAIPPARVAVSPYCVLK